MSIINKNLFVYFFVIVTILFSYSFGFSQKSGLERIHNNEMTLFMNNKFIRDINVNPTDQNSTPKNEYVVNKSTQDLLLSSNIIRVNDDRVRLIDESKISNLNDIRDTFNKHIADKYSKYKERILQYLKKAKVEKIHFYDIVFNSEGQLIYWDYNFITQNGNHPSTALSFNEFTDLQIALDKIFLDEPLFANLAQDIQNYGYFKQFGTLEIK